MLLLAVSAHEEEPAAANQQKHQRCGAANHNEFALALRSGGFGTALFDLIVVCHCPRPSSWDGLDAAELALNDAIQRPPARERPV